MNLTFDWYVVTDDGVQMGFVGPLGTYTIRVTDAELAAVANLAQFRALVTAKLQRKVQAAGIAARLDRLVGQSVSI